MELTGLRSVAFVNKYYKIAKWILTHWAELNARVLIVTDRDELDEQV